ncbi:MAG: FtsH protease activity modulator HflK [Candidatus Aminicenantes bacterium]|nr:FtsH protease activity modulator HflK [Candidatus Aminicenantes bacterium]MDH5714787.1 FtsH protease activity modulator HflK [Candidatus Aminicenantes bacterium]
MANQYGDFAQIKLPPLKAKWIVTGIVVLVALYVVFSTFYSVKADEVGVILRFGRYIRITQPGLHLKLPFSIEKLYRVRIKHIFKEEFGFRTIRPGIRTEYAQAALLDESLMLTGDLNTAVVEWIVQYRVKNPVDYLFKVRNIGETIRNASEFAMREIVGDRSVTEVLTIGRIEIGTEVEKTMQQVLDSYQSGIHIVTAKLQDVNPPDPVKPAFNEVNEAKQEREKLINEAWQEYNRVIPQATGEAERTIRKAEGYALNRVNRANGDAQKFISIWQEYSKAKDVTRRRLYLEMMTDILPKIEKKYIIDSSQQGMLPFLDLTPKEIKEK